MRSSCLVGVFVAHSSLCLTHRVDNRPHRQPHRAALFPQSSFLAVVLLLSPPLACGSQHTHVEVRPLACRVARAAACYARAQALDAADAPATRGQRMPFDVAAVDGRRPSAQLPCPCLSADSPVSLRLAV